LRERADVVPAGIVEARGAGFNHLHIVRECADIGFLMGQVRLVGIHPLVEPGHNVDVVADPLREILVGMVVTIDQPRQHELSGGVDHMRGAMLRQHLVRRTDGNDVTALDRDRAVTVDPALGVDGYDVAIANDQIGYNTSCGVRLQAPTPSIWRRLWA